MSVLPYGYYAVVAKDEEGALKSTLKYKGVEYELSAGVNAFESVLDAYAAASEIPGCVLPGLEYDEFKAPVILFDEGTFVIDKLTLTKSAYFLGQTAGISPNVPTAEGCDAPSMNPEWKSGVSELKGSYWRGVITAADTAAELIVFDGFSNLDARYADGRKEGETMQVVFRNIVHRGYSGHTLYLLNTAKANDINLKMENIRLCDFDDFDYGANFCRANVHSAVFEGICFSGTGQLFGLTSYSRGFNNASEMNEISTYSFRGCYFGNLHGENGLSSCCRAETNGVCLNIEDCVFVDAAKENQPFVTPSLSNGNCSAKISRCRFFDTRNNTGSAVCVFGDGDNIIIENCSFEGFAAFCEKAPKPVTDAPDFIGQTLTEPDGEVLDPHEISSDADFSVLDKMYEGCKCYYGDLHVHSNSGGTSDGKTPIEQYVADMDREQLDFVALVDHRQMRGFFLPAWDDERMIIGTEPGTRITDLKACRHNQSEIHYNMLFPHKYGLAMVLANFPEFEFHGDELTGSFKYPRFTVERFQELCRYVESIGGIVVHPHPKTMMASDDPLDYYECFGEHSFIETLYAGYSSAASARNYDLWVKILAAGKHMYTSAGSDSHGAVTNSAVSSFYTKERRGLTFFNKMKSADFAVGAFGMQMEIDGNPMGSEIEYCEGQVLRLRIGDFFAAAFKENTAYELRVYSDEGLCYASRFNGKYPQQLALKLKKRRFYRAEVVDVTHSYRIGIGNPIWLDK